MIDYRSIATGRLAKQFDNSPKLKALVGNISDLLQDIETKAEALIVERWISTAIGKQLDGCGYNVGEARRGRSDDDYRRAILFRVFVNTSNGTIPDVIYATKYLTDTWQDCQYLPMYPANFIVFSDGYFSSTGVYKSLLDIKPAGVGRVHLLVSYGDKPLRFAASPKDVVLGLNDGNEVLIADSSEILLEPYGDDEYDEQSELGGVVPPVFGADGGLFSISGGFLAVHTPSDHVLIGDLKMTGLYT